MPGHRLTLSLSLSSKLFPSFSVSSTPTAENLPPTPQRAASSGANKPHRKFSLSSKFRWPSSPVRSASTSTCPSPLSSPLNSPEAVDPSEFMKNDASIQPSPRYARRPDDVIPPGHSLTRRRTVVTPQEACLSGLETLSPTPRPRPVHRRGVPSLYQHESRGLQQINDKDGRVFIAFEDDIDAFGRKSSHSCSLKAENLRDPSGRRFDNLVHLSSSSASGRAPCDGVLHIDLPARNYPHYLRDMEKLSQDPNVLIDDRDKYEALLPVDTLARARDWIFDAQGTVLITAPRDARADAVTLALAYVAFSDESGQRSSRVMTETLGRYKPIWQYALSKTGMALAGRVAARRLVYRHDRREYL
ncbi:hypothetical protein CYLTODRAFT_52061 [Cylindrobasidium torrendii FP15055 ss-10]|uniref:Uncharacterized protein n=1 Tax=Cylindrobasidium torrendii FP15055 ss-10 TaxID=1314674 RepID=A0A0D7B6K5_9AGAR|nr:hypothetical protein CYLTODRAFT_52061 [Cylindrobasidium torrendii FP15055 ss-10]